MNANDSQAQRQLKVQRFHQLAEQHPGLVIASQLAARQSSGQFALKPKPERFKRRQQ